MKRFVILVSAVIVLSMALDACTMGQTPPPAAQAPATEPPATEPPVAEAPTGDALVTVDLAGPAMEVGSKYVYIDGAVLVAVPGGPFIMGYSYADNPEREVTVSDFWVYDSEVTNQQYSLCVNAGKCSAPDEKDNPSFGNYRFINFPVVGVTHKQSVDYCTFVHGRLPTEAEWEKAARGPEGNVFPWGDGAPKCDLLNFNFCKGKAIDIQSYPEGVSYYGLFDMAGNIREWAADWYKNDYFKDASGEDPLGPELGDKRAIRSSSFADSGDFAIAAHRYSLKPSAHLPDLGFRCVVEDPAYFAPWCEQLANFGYGPDGSVSDCIPDPQCNEVQIQQSPLCSEGGTNIFYNIVTFSMSSPPPDDWSHEAPGCDLVAGTQYECRLGDGPLSAEGTCTDVIGCEPGCPPHYDQVGDTCVWDGSGTIGTECIAGSTYDPINQCCTATPGSAVDFKICPAGTYPLDGDCVDDPEPPIPDSISEPLETIDCTWTGGDDDTSGCDPLTDPNCPGDDDTTCGPNNPVSCTYPRVPDKSGCNCVCPPGAPNCR